MKYKSTVWIIVAILYVCANIALNALVISTVNNNFKKGQKQRTDTQVLVRSFECILLVSPDERTSVKVSDCHKQAKESVELE